MNRCRSMLHRDCNDCDKKQYTAKFTFINILLIRTKLKTKYIFHVCSAFKHITTF